MKLFSLFMILFITNPFCLTASAGMLPEMRISVENNELHVQTEAVKKFAESLEKKLRGQMNVRFFSNARLFRDRDVIRAMAHGKVEMAVPGTWHVTRFEPGVGIFLLPVFYGRPVEANYSVLGSSIGKEINDRIENNLQLKVLGRWIDLGHAHLFGIHRKINRHEDIEGIRVRVAGGVANKLRIEAMGGNPTIISWPDLPEYMQIGKVDAVLTTYETVKSAELWKKGVESVFEDQEYFPQYIPLVRWSFWTKLSPDIQQILITTWEDHVDAARMAAADAQKQAKETLMQKGVEIIVPAPRTIEKMREKLMRLQSGFVHELQIDPELVRQVDAFF